MKDTTHNEPQNNSQMTRNMIFWQNKLKEFEVRFPNLKEEEFQNLILIENGLNKLKSVKRFHDYKNLEQAMNRLSRLLGRRKRDKITIMFLERLLKEAKEKNLRVLFGLFKRQILKRNPTEEILSQEGHKVPGQDFEIISNFNLHNISENKSNRILNDKSDQISNLEPYTHQNVKPSVVKNKVINTNTTTTKHIVKNIERIKLIKSPDKYLIVMLDALDKKKRSQAFNTIKLVSLFKKIKASPGSLNTIQHIQGIQRNKEDNEFMRTELILIILDKILEYRKRINTRNSFDQLKANSQGKFKAIYGRVSKIKNNKSLSQRNHKMNR